MICGVKSVIRSFLMILCCGVVIVLVLLIVLVLMILILIVVCWLVRLVVVLGRVVRN